MSRLLPILKEVADTARALVREAGRELTSGRKEGYRLALERRADLLQELRARVADEIENLPPALADSARATVREISSEAAEARAIGSLWYMSILLAGEKNDPDGPNELDRLIALLEAAG